MNAHDNTTGAAVHGRRISAAGLRYNDPFAGAGSVAAGARRSGRGAARRHVLMKLLDKTDCKTMGKIMGKTMSKTMSKTMGAAGRREGPR